ncbi:hypothetical protein [Clostridium paridis]|uniref:Uncharacterized protein n=1 Tax=Clostridium paridis TaxID=2803863 RepID=A0A937FF18_9CLOT|nr:hypothetical protein [Clostridium paridis]MBL4930667.1 hypothetical protein [Clostridium paridis]
MKRIISIGLSALSLVVLTALPFTKVDAKGQSQESKQIQSLKTKYDLKTVSKAPEGVKPYKFDTVEEAEKFIESIKAQEAKTPNHVDLGNTEVGKKNGQATPMTYGNEHRSILLGLCYMNIDASIEYLWSSSMGQNYYNRCTGVSSYLSGVYYGNAWTQSSYAANIVNGGRQLNVTVYGKFDYYILINTSLTSFAGKTASYSASWTNP